jgi:hypothetical protein
LSAAANEMTLNKLKLIITFDSEEYGDENDADNKANKGKC